MATLDYLAQIVTEICSAGSMFASCNHRPRSPRSPIFADWYLILRVNEDEKIDVIRKRYLHLALQLHPDKNKHPKASAAFKLVSDAYACISDKAKRKAFNSERRKNFCKDCYSEFQSSTCHGTTTLKKKPCRPTGHEKPLKPLDTQLRELQKIFIEEFEVMQSCLRANHACRQQEESPLFNPHNQLNGYPHLRQHVLKKPSNPRHYERSHVQDHCGRRIRGSESPVYKIRAKNYPTSIGNLNALDIRKG